MFRDALSKKHQRLNPSKYQRSEMSKQGKSEAYVAHERGNAAEWRSDNWERLIVRQRSEVGATILI